MQDVSIDILNADSVKRRLDKLSKIGGKQSEIYRAFNRASKPMRVAARSKAPRSGNTQYNRGPFWKSIKLLKSKKYKNLFYLGPQKGRSSRYDGWYGIFLEGGTRERTQKKTGKNVGRIQATRFMSRAYNEQKAKVFSRINIELGKLISKMDN